MTLMAGEKLVVQKRRRTFYSALHDYSMIPVAIVSINLITKYLDVLNWSISRRNIIIYIYTLSKIEIKPPFKLLARHIVMWTIY